MIELLSQAISGGIVHCTGDPCTLCDLSILADRFTRFLMFNIMLPIAALMILIGGIMLLTARDNQNQQTQGKAVLTYAVLGMIIVFAAWLIVTTFLTTLGYKDVWYAFPDPASCIPATTGSEIAEEDGTTDVSEGGINCACTASVGSDKILASGPFSVSADTDGDGSLDCLDSQQCIDCAAVTAGAECVLCTDSGGGLDCGVTTDDSGDGDFEKDEDTENNPLPEFNFYCTINGVADYTLSDCDACTAAGGTCKNLETDDTDTQTNWYCIAEQVSCNASSNCDSCFAIGGVCTPEKPPGCS